MFQLQKTKTTKILLPSSFSLYNLMYIWNVFASVLLTYMSICMFAACGGQKRMPDPLELDIEMVVSLHVGA